MISNFIACGPALGFHLGMDDLMRLVRTYRLTSSLADCQRLGEQIFRKIGPDLHLFVFSKVAQHSAEDVFQEVLVAVATSLKKFQGGTEKEFWAWCYAIARRRLADHFRKQAADRLTPVPPSDLWQMMDISAQVMPMTAEIKHDLEYAMKLLINSKPECYEFLWNHFVFDLDYADIAEDKGISYDAARMKVGRCLDEVKALVS